MLISVCIPAYKNVSFLERLLQSIREQDFNDFEVILTDDSPDESVEHFVKNFQGLPVLRYFRNPRPLGTPENWNAAIRQARGKWIKIMHDDDWFRDTGSLGRFSKAAEQSSAHFIFSAYCNQYLDQNREELITLSRLRRHALERNPASLFSRNVIGPPSVVMHRNDQRFWYDPKTKWVVDIDFYIRYLASSSFVYIPRPLVNVGISDEQVTAGCLHNPEVEIPENFYLLGKIGTRHLRNPLVYDAFWRMIRNLSVDSVADIRASGFGGEIPDSVLSMIRWQNSLPDKWLKWGYFSKPVMFLHYLLHGIRNR